MLLPARRGLVSSQSLRVRPLVLLAVLLSVVGVVQVVVLAAAPRLSVAKAVSAASGTGGQFVAEQGRILDTRAASSVGGYSTAMPAGAWRTVNVAGATMADGSQLPVDISAVAIDFSVLSPATAGVIHADKDGSSPSTVVTYMNYAASGSQSSTATLAVAEDGKIQVQASTNTNMLIDVQGYYTADDYVAAGGYVPVQPSRLVDTRTGKGLPQQRVQSGTTTTIQVSGNASVPAGASGAIVNFTILNQSASGYFTAYDPDISGRPKTALNYPTSASMSFGAQVGLSTASSAPGSFSFYNLGSSVDLLVDVVGYFTQATSSGAFTPATARIYDSRTAGNTTLAASSARTIQVGGLHGIPLAGAGISAVSANVAISTTDSSTSGYARVWANGTTEPTSTSSVNYQPNNVWMSNMVTTALGADGAIRIRNLGTVPITVVIDVEGWYSNAIAPIPAGQDQTQQNVTLQASAAGVGAWVSYLYRVGQSNSFANVPLSDVQDGNGNAPSSWPVTTSNNAFTAYTWNIRKTLTPSGGGVAPNSLVQVEACYGTSQSDANPACSMPSNVQFSQTAFGDGYATEDVGPGTLAELTGDYEIGGTDADTATALSGLSVGRSLTTLAPADAGVAPASQRTDASGVFGPAWTADLPGPQTGDGDVVVTPHLSDGYLVFTGSDGATWTYQATSPIGTYPVTFVGVGIAAANGDTVTQTDAATITLVEFDNTVTTWTKTGSAWPVAKVNEVGPNATSSYSYNTAGLPTRISAPAPAGVSCDATPDTTIGCRSLILDYQTLSVSGTSVARLQDVKESIPTSGSTTPIAVANYEYTTAGLLADSYDPRIIPNLTTAYAYNSSSQLATVTPPGQTAWSLGYDSSKRLTTVTRAQPTGPAAVTTMVYGVPLTGSNAPTPMGTATTGTWDETADLPVIGTAIFGADHNPAGVTPGTVTSSDWPYASIDYLDVNGQTVNDAQYGAGGWQIDTTQYDANGNDVWDLSAGNRAQALTPTSDTDPYVAGKSSNVTRADLLASTSVYNPLDPSLETDSYGPTHPVTLHDGTVIDAQTHVASTYDEGAPNSDVNPVTGMSYDLPTTVTTSATNVATNTDTGYPDNQVTHYGYAAISSGDTDGWTLGAPTGTTVQMGATASSSDLVTKTRSDGNGRIIEQRLSNDTTGTTPRTTLTTYFAASGSGACADPARVGLVCSTAPAAQPSTGSPLPVVTYGYNKYDDPTTKVETYGTGSSQVVRTTTSGYDSAQRRISNSITVTPNSAGGTSVPAVNYGYDTNTGLPTTTSTGTGPSITSLGTTYDSLGRMKTYTDATGNVSTTVYDIDNRPTSLNDGKGTTTYNYDNGGGSASSEHRGMATGEDIGVSGAPSAFSATYDTAGNLATETYPNGLVATRHYDNAGNLTSLVYAKSGSTWMTFAQDFNALGQVADQSSPQSSQKFAYDPANRLTTVQDIYSGSCTARAYTFDTHSNRTSSSSAANNGSSCPTVANGATTNRYDDADRLTSDSAGSYTYDTLGRTLAIPSGDAQGVGSHASITGIATLGYYANDMAATEAQGSTNISLTLDPDQDRINTQIESSIKTTDHYAGSDDSPAWISTDASTWTRNLSGIDGGFVATSNQAGVTTLDLSNPHGDVVATTTDAASASGVASYSETTEYGAPRNPTTVSNMYGYLGSAQRSENGLGGLVFMGVRMYNSASGRFLSADPLPGGNANAYIYPTNPISVTDISGQCGTFGNPFSTCGVWRIDEQFTDLWQRKIPLRHGSVDYHSEGGVGYGEFGSVHIEEGHVSTENGGPGEENWFSNEGMHNDVGTALLRGDIIKYRGEYDRKYEWINTNPACGCKYRVNVWVNTRKAPSGDGIVGVTSAWKTLLGR